MFKLLIDTCVWLDIAKDYQQQALLGGIEELLHQKKISLILPQTICDEFARNKAKIAKDGCKSQTDILKRTKDIIHKFGDPKKKNSVLDQLNEVDYKIPLLGESAIESIKRIEKIFASANVLSVPDYIKLRAAQRAIDKKAPFHRQRNGIDDSILIEMYADSVHNAKPSERLAFVTHNTKDFSHPTDNNKLPHPDIAVLFSRVKSLYFISLGEAMKRIAPDQISDLMLEYEWTEESRRLAEIIDAVSELLDKIWYNRHQNLRIRIERSEIKLVEKDEGQRNVCQRDIWQGAQKAAKSLEKKYGLQDLGPWDDFEWGMLNGKLSALRWVLGEEWDMLDT
ncbi:MAG: DUF4935 domain-containing protein [Candidatus Omnitrophica bacterium]|nr:DUF4935 domain-containing protein [Candidatus Omnitrophota bacterium]